MIIAHVNADRGVDPTKKKGAAVHVVAMRKAFARSGARVAEFDVSDSGLLRERLETECANGAFDLIYERHALGSFTASEFARSRGIPHVIEVNAPLAEEEGLYRAGSRTEFDSSREEEYFGSAARVLCVSTACARHAVERGADPARVVVEPNGVDPELFRPRTDDRLRDSLVPRGALVVGFHGRLRPWHNFALLVEALDVLIAEGMNVHLLALGEGDFAAEIQRSLVRDHATLVAWRPHDEAAAVVACMDVVPLTYAKDAPFWYSPLKLLEAMAVGAVPIVPRLGDLAQSVVHGIDGICYSAGDTHALCSAIRSMNESDEWRRWLSGNARRHAQGSTWDAIARRVLNVIPMRKAVG